MDRQYTTSSFTEFHWVGEALLGFRPPSAASRWPSLRSYTGSNLRPCVVGMKDMCGSSSVHTGERTRSMPSCAGRQASKGRLPLVELLADHGARVAARDGQGATPLHRAAASGKVGARGCPPPCAVHCGRAGGGGGGVPHARPKALLASCQSAVALRREPLWQIRHMFLVQFAASGRKGPSRSRCPFVAFCGLHGTNKAPAAGVVHLGTRQESPSTFCRILRG